MVISDVVQTQFFRAATIASGSKKELIRLPPTIVMSTNLPYHYPCKRRIIKTHQRLNIWTIQEHDRFLIGLERFPHGPWKSIAALVGTRTTRQTMTHAQKYRQKIHRITDGKRARLLRARFPDDHHHEQEVEVEAVVGDGTNNKTSGMDTDQDRISTGLDMMEMPSMDWDFDSLLDDMDALLGLA